VARVLLDGKAACDARNTHNAEAGYTALCVAGDMGNVGVVNVLLMYGDASSSVRVRTNNGRTPLHLAAAATPPGVEHFGPIMSREGVVRALLQVPGIDVQVRRCARGTKGRGRPACSCGIGRSPLKKVNRVRKAPIASTPTC
jgi:hypothetical protein